MRLVIAEKPKAGRAIAAAVVGGARTQDGFIVGTDVTVTWCAGHLLEQAQPDYYDPRLGKWSLDALPIAIAEDRWTLLPRKDRRDQLAVIERLLRTASEVVHAGDKGREGQLLVDEVLEYFGWRGRTLRIDTSNLTPEALRRAWHSLRDNAALRPIYNAALCRQRADWLVGMNLSRGATLKIGVTTSIGRVQTPTLGLVVRRDREIEGHSSHAFYTVVADVATAKTAGTFVHDDEAKRIFDKTEAEAIASALSDSTVNVTLTESVKTENPPLPFILASFQKEAEKRYGWRVKQSLEILQSVYEGQYVTYPRTECPYLPEDQAQEALTIAKRTIDAMGRDGTAFATALSAMTPSKAIYNDAKIAALGDRGEHHGIIPTTKPMPIDAPHSVSAAAWTKMRQAWQIVAERFLLGLLPAAVYDVREASFAFQERIFRCKGERLRPGTTWRQFVPRNVTDMTFNAPPGDVLARAGKVSVKQGKTAPPKPYTESSLVDDMGAAAKFVSEPRLKAILKERAGIGTAATQADIIETLKARGFVAAEGKGKTARIKSTPFGRYVIDQMPPVLSDVGVTAAWELALDEIADGKGDPGEFMQRIGRYVAKQTEAVKSATFPTPPKPSAEPAPRKAGKAGSAVKRNCDSRHASKKAPRFTGNRGAANR